MITPRRTRLIRVADLQQFKDAITALCAHDLSPAADALPARLVIVPSRGAATMLGRTLEAGGPAPKAAASAFTRTVTRDALYDALHERLVSAPRRLTSFERDAVAQASAAAAARDTGDLPFRVRPGLVSEMLRFYDQLKRQSQSVQRFGELILEALGGDVEDRGANRLLGQTTFLAHAFAEYERRLAASDAVDEHALRQRLIADDTAVPLAHVVVTVADWIADPAGLFVADLNLLNRLPHLAAIDIVATESVLRSGFHERLHGWWPGLEELHAPDVCDVQPAVKPRLMCPEPVGAAAPLWMTRRDREEELIAVARRLEAEPPDRLDRVAVVYKQPLPYLYLAADTFTAAGIAWTGLDALPLAGEPVVAALDLVLDAIESDLTRSSLIALLRSPHFVWSQRLTRESIGAADWRLSDWRYLGGRQRLEALVGVNSAETSVDGGDTAAGRVRAEAEPALLAALDVARQLAVFTEKHPASAHLTALNAFLERHFIPLDADREFREREQQARQRLFDLLSGVASAHRAHHDLEWHAADLASAVHRWVGEETCAAPATASGVCLLDDQAARYGAFDDVTIVGLIESEWPERPRRNIFYPPALLRALGWPSEAERHAAADARFLDLVASPRSRVELSTFLLENEAIVSRSMQLDEVVRARLSTVTSPDQTDDSSVVDQASERRSTGGGMDTETREWYELRTYRSPASQPEFHGSVTGGPVRVWSVSALETYIGCPFKFFSQHVLKLEEEPDDEEVMDPRQQGQFVHEVFETFFRDWQERGGREITAANLPVARARFTAIVDRAIESIPEGEAGLERTRLLGSPVAAGLGEAVFRMEAERAVPVAARLLEHSLNGPVTLTTEAGERTVTIRGKVDRLDLLADGTFRVIDYKLGWPPDRSRALQLPIYALCAEQQLRTLGRRWTLGEAMYLAFKGPRRVVPLFTNDAGRVETLARAQQRLSDIIDAIERGEFPPSPDDVYRCETCSFAAVCRKDYVGDI